LITVPERLQDELEFLRKMFDGFSSSLRVAAPGIIQSFDAAKQTATVRLAIREKVLNSESREVEDIEIPILVDVPVITMSAGGFSLTLPVTAGDECLVIFGDNCFDAWYQSGGVQNQMDRRRHDLSDGFAICGVKSQPAVITSYSTTAAELRNAAGTVKVRVEAAKVVVSADTVELSNAAALKKLIDERFATLYDAHTHSGVVAGGGVTGVPAVLMTPILANYSTAKTKAG
jgi:hypothetical protein